MSGMFEDRLAKTHVVGEDYADSMKLARPARPAPQSEPVSQPEFQPQQLQIPALDGIDPAVLMQAMAALQVQQQLAVQLQQQQSAPVQPQTEPAVEPVAEVEPQQAPVEAEHEEFETDGAECSAEPEVEDDFEPEPETLSSEPEHDEVGTLQRAGSSATSAPAQTSEAAEPTPQRDDPDDGEHVQSEPEPEPESAQESVVVEDDPQDEAESEQADLPQTRQQGENPWRSTAQSGQEQPDLVAMVVSAQPARTQVSAPLEWVGPNVAFEFPGDSSQVKVPRQLLAALRACLRPMGKDFADKVSISSLVTGFMLARLGLPATGADPNTEQAARAFAEMTPELSALEHRLEATTTALQELAGSVRSMERDTEAVRRSMDAVELSNAYLLTDRYSPISSRGTTGSTLEVQHPKVLGTRENLRKQAESQRNADKISDGRPW